MAQLAGAQDDTIGALSEGMDLDPSTSSRDNLRALEAAALVEIAIVETDLRRRAVWLTEAGARRLKPPCRSGGAPTPRSPSAWMLISRPGSRARRRAWRTTRSAEKLDKCIALIMVYNQL